MITLIFLLCTESMCFTQGPPDLFSSIQQCEDVGMSVIIENYKEAELGRLPKHRAVFKCIDWGEPL
jgi:hypothetical protein